MFDAPFLSPRPFNAAHVFGVRLCVYGPCPQLAEAAPQEEEEKEEESKKVDSDLLQVAHLKRSRQLQRLQLSKGGSMPHIKIPVEEDEDADADTDVDADEDDDAGSLSPVPAAALTSPHHLHMSSRDSFTGVQSLPSSPELVRKASRTCLRRSGSRSESSLHHHVHFAASPTVKEI